MEYPNDPSLNSSHSPSPEINPSSSPSVIRFTHPLSRRVADGLIERVYRDIVPAYLEKYPEIALEPLVNSYQNLLGFDFKVALHDNDKEAIKDQLQMMIEQLLKVLEKRQRKSNFQPSTNTPLSFTELLGTYRVKVNYIIFPVMINIIFATFLAWMAKIQAEWEINAAYFPDEENAAQIIANGLIPVAISAVFITVIWLLIRKFGMIVFKYIMGIIIFFYLWYGLVMFTTVFFDYYLQVTPEELINATRLNLLYNVLFFGFAVIVLITAVLFFRNRLVIWQRNLIVLLYSIFMGSIIGMALPTWTAFSFAIFLSIWDLITVFKGPLGKIGNMIKDNQSDMQKQLKEKLDRGEIGIDEVVNYTQFVSLQTEDENGDGNGIKNGKLDLSEIEVELGSGDLILYSALVANIFAFYGSWFLSIFAIIGVLGGAGLTLYLLISKKRMLPALPFSMFFGIALFFLGLLLQYLLPILNF